jgi:hypothetical protein
MRKMGIGLLFAIPVGYQLVKITRITSMVALGKPRRNPRAGFNATSKKSWGFPVHS